MSPRVNDRRHGRRVWRRGCCDGPLRVLSLLPLDRAPLLPFGTGIEHRHPDAVEAVLLGLRTASGRRTPSAAPARRPSTAGPSSPVPRREWLSCTPPIPSSSSPPRSRRPWPPQVGLQDRTSDDQRNMTVVLPEPALVSGLSPRSRREFCSHTTWRVPLDAASATAIDSAATHAVELEAGEVLSSAVVARLPDGAAAFWPVSVPFPPLVCS